MIETQPRGHVPTYTVHDFTDGDAQLTGLARVSTDAQDAQLQRDALEAAGCAREYEEKISTRKVAADRPGLAAALDYLRPGDTLCVWKLDRLGRSTKEILTICDDLAARGITVRILTGTMAGTYAPHGEGKFFFTMMAAFAELERDINHERTMAGLAAARTQGRVGGRPTVMDEDKIAAARARRERGESPAKIARALGVSRASVYRHLQPCDERPAPAAARWPHEAAGASPGEGEGRVCGQGMACPVALDPGRLAGQHGSPGRVGRPALAVWWRPGVLLCPACGRP